MVAVEEALISDWLLNLVLAAEAGRLPDHLRLKIPDGGDGGAA